MNKKSSAALTKAIDAVAEKIGEIPDSDDRVRTQTKKAALAYVRLIHGCVARLTESEEADA